ncbi:MAG: hypothetical protein ACRD5K_06375 [Candidatus Acidiferrales bacterium]
MRLEFLGIALSAAMCLFAVPAAKAQPGCVSVGTTVENAYGMQFYTVTNNCAIAVEGVFTTKGGGSYSFGPLSPGATSIMQSTATGVFRHYDCEFPKLPRTAGIGDWASWTLPRYDSNPAHVVCQ